MLAPDERRLEAAGDRFRVVQHAPEDVVAASPLGGDRVTDEAPRSLADEDVRVAGGGAQSIRLLERRARDERPPEGAVARDDVPRRDACTSDEPAGDERVGRANGAKRVVLARHGNAEDPEKASVRRAARRASVGSEGCDRILAAPAELVTSDLRVGAGRGQVGEQEGDRLTRLLHSSAGFPRHTRRRSRDLGVLSQDRPLELLQLRTRLHAEFLDQRGSCSAVCLERVRLPARAVEGENELAAEPLAERLFADQSFELRDEVRVTSEGEVRIDAVLERLDSKLGEGRRRGADRFTGQVGKRISPPQRERLVEQRSGLAWLARTRLVAEAAETVEIELTELDTEQIAGRPSDDAIAELAAEAEDVVLQRSESRGRRIVAPDQVGQPVGCDDSVRVEQQRCDDGAALRAAERQHTLAVEDLDWPENPELHVTTKPQLRAAVTAGAQFVASFSPFRTMSMSRRNSRPSAS